MKEGEGTGEVEEEYNEVEWERTVHHRLRLPALRLCHKRRCRRIQMHRSGLQSQSAFPPWDRGRGFLLGNTSRTWASAPRAGTSLLQREARLSEFFSLGDFGVLAGSSHRLLRRCSGWRHGVTRRAEICPLLPRLGGYKPLLRAAEDLSEGTRRIHNSKHTGMSSGAYELGDH